MKRLAVMFDVNRSILKVAANPNRTDVAQLENATIQLTDSHYRRCTTRYG